MRKSASPVAAKLPICVRPCGSGKFVFCGDDKFYIRGVTYGPFRPDEDGEPYHDQEAIERDFQQMSANGINAVRTYTVPPRWFLDLALRYGLRVMVGLPWEQHITFLDTKERRRSIEKRVRAGVRACSGHPAVLCYTIGNEIPASIVRWYGAPRIESFLERLYYAAKSEDPGGLVTYVNYPTTEFLNLPFLDLVCFNAYLESRDRWESYLARLQNLADERPLIIAEVGLDSRRHGEAKQAQALDWLIRSSFAKGCAGTFVFAWTDEWHRGGYDIENWDFGLTRRDRSSKPALETVRQAFAQLPLPPTANPKRISVVVCTYNGHRLIRDTLEALSRLRYPNLEVIVVDDGSSPSMTPIVEPYGFQTIRTANQGLSAARNVGMEAATGEIIAYIDDDAFPDPDWLTYLADAFAMSTHVGIGGHNIAPPDEGQIAHCVANAPGGPVHVLLSDEVAEHIPGCNMAFRCDALKAVGGFDERFRVAGDDVDLCWRLQQRGGTLGFCPGAMVWHHRRNSIRAYWKQQKGYGHAEALLDKKWPEKYNSAGHLSWVGRIYGKGSIRALGQVSRIYHGIWGSAPFQRLYQREPNALLSILPIPEWYLILFTFGLLEAMGRHYSPFQMAGSLFLLAILAPAVQAWRSSRAVAFSSPPQSAIAHAVLRLITATLYALQPIARLWGRVRCGISPWRTRVQGFRIPRLNKYVIWRENWTPPEKMLESLERELRVTGATPLRGGIFDSWDLEVRGGMLGSCKVRMAVEEHGAGRQLFRFQAWPHHGRLFLLLVLFLTVGAADAAISHAGMAGAVLGFSAVLAGFHGLRQCGAAMAIVHRAMGWSQTEQGSIAAQCEIVPAIRAQLEQAP